MSLFRDNKSWQFSCCLSNTITICLYDQICLIQMIHNTVVDTSIVFPHRLGLPYKRALRTLMAEYLQKIIQDDGI